MILVGAMMPLSVAMIQTGAAKLIAEHLVHWRRRCGVRRPCSGDFLSSRRFSARSSATRRRRARHSRRHGGGHRHRHVAAARADGLCVAGAASLLTPIATSTNMMVMGPGGYRFGDYWKFGLPLYGVVPPRRSRLRTRFCGGYDAGAAGRDSEASLSTRTAIFTKEGAPTMIRRLTKWGKWGIALVVIALSTLLAVRAYDSQRGDPLEPWHTFPA